MITLETTLTSRGYYANERERERERKKNIFLPYLWPKTQVSEIKGKPGWKKVKGPVLDKE